MSLEPEPPELSVPPAISVIVAVHNVSGQVAEAMTSLLAQTFTDFEVLVVDDGSTDGSGSVAAAAFGNDTRFRMITQRNQGLSGARNVGLEQARGPFVTFLDGDDAYAPGFLHVLHTALLRDGTDWAACAIALCYADGAQVPHPAIHAVEERGAARCIDLLDARQVARVFPSAWNKLYRRAALGDLRFVDGSWFEDHEYFWACATRCPRLSYVPEPLYLHRRDREGQITGSDSDRVFEQLVVLERLRPRIEGGSFTHARDGFAQLATRLVHERALVIRDRARRARFIAEVREAFARWTIAYDAAGDRSISAGFGLALAGLLPLSVVVLAQDQGALTETLEALAAQSMRDFDLHVLAPNLIEVPTRLACGLAVQRIPAGCTRLADLCARLPGEAVMIYAPGESPAKDGLSRLVNLMTHTQADLAFGGFQRLPGGYHDGWTDNTVVGSDLSVLAPLGDTLALGASQVLRVHPLLGNRIMRRVWLGRVAGALTLPGNAVTRQALVLASGLAAHTVAYTQCPVAQRRALRESVQAVADIARRIRALPEAPFAGLPQGWRGTVFFRLVRLHSGRHGAAAAGVLHDLRVLVRAFGSGFLRHVEGARPDPETPRLVRRAVRLWRMSRR